MRTLAVIGSRGFSNYTLLKEFLDTEKPVKIVSGGASGADALAKKYAEERDIELVEILPDYETYGKVAPILRNKKIVSISDGVLAFWDGESKGSKYTVDYAIEQGKHVQIIDISKRISRSDVVGEPENRLDSWSRYLDSKRAIKGSAADLKAAKLAALSYADTEKRLYFSQKYVKGVFDSSKYNPLKGKDNFFLVMPSSSGNQFPLALALELKDNFGGRIITDFAEQKHESGIKKLSGIKKVLADRSFSLSRDFINNIELLKGKNIVLVDDLISTGITIDFLRIELNKAGIKTDYICSLVSTSASLTTDNSVEKLAKRVAPEEPFFPDYKEKMSVVFHNSLGGAMFHLQRGIKSDSDIRMVREYVDKKYSEYIQTLKKDIPIEKKKSEDFFDNIKEECSITLPRSIAESIKSSSLGYDVIREIIDSSIEKIREIRYKWSTEDLTKCDLALYSSESAKDKFAVKFENNWYWVYLISDCESKFLGKDNSLDSIKNRIEQYTVFKEIRSNLDAAISRKRDPQFSLDL